MIRETGDGGKRPRWSKRGIGPVAQLHFNEIFQPHSRTKLDEPTRGCRTRETSPFEAHALLFNFGCLKARLPAVDFYKTGVMMIKSESWLAAHLFYGEPRIPFLADALKPFVDRQVSEGAITRYYYICFKDRGPQIMLRLQGEAEILQQTVKPALTRHFEDYMQRQPSWRKEPESQPPAAACWFPNNSIQYLTLAQKGYQMEPYRYGGEGGVSISIGQFHASTIAVLAAIEEGRCADLQGAQMVAIQLLTAFVHALGMPPSEVVCFFEKVYNVWVKVHQRIMGDMGLAGDAIQNEIARVEKQFSLMFQSGRTGLEALLGTIWANLDDAGQFEQEWLNQWYESMVVFRSRFESHFQAGKLKTGKGYQYDESIPFPAANQAKWSIYLDYYHPINNRLGLDYSGEWRLAYILKETMKSLCA